MQTFREFMEGALYHPELGFYARRKPRADFYTAPELHPAFAAVLASEIARRLPAGGTVVEMGAGDGTLAAQLLARLPAGTPYTMVEKSLSPKVEGARTVRSLDELAPLRGVFFSNELVDAFPVHVLEKSGGRVYELYVDAAGAERLGELSTPALQEHAERVELQDGERHAVNLDLEGWLAQVASLITAGALMTIDYGHRYGATPNPPRGFWRHTQPEMLTARPGEQDLTASVDFERMIALGEKAGLIKEQYGTLSKFLIDGGISKHMPMGDSAVDFKSRSQIKTLIHPEGMGEVFKVLIQTKPEATLS
jgi:SAM-dependent MidA family methyltransferase